MNLTRDTGNIQLALAVLLLAGMVGSVGTALGFEHLGGYIPCKLCLAQREPYYAGIPVALLASLSAWRRWPSCLTRGLLAIAGLLMLYTLALGVYHSGAEWGFWPGPTDCGATAAGGVTDAGSLLDQLTDKKPPSCDEAAGRFLGLSFAGWNVIAALILAGIAFRAAFGRANA